MFAFFNSKDKDVQHGEETDALFTEDEFNIPLLNPAPRLFTKDVERQRKNEAVIKKYSIQKKNMEYYTQS